MRRQASTCRSPLSTVSPAARAGNWQGLDHHLTAGSPPATNSQHNPLPRPITRCPSHRNVPDEDPFKAAPIVLTSLDATPTARTSRIRPTKLGVQS